MKDKTFLITGASGFVGSVLMRRLVKMGCRIHAFVSPKGDLWRIQDLLPAVILHRGDLCDESFVRRAVVEANPDIIYHLATHGGSSSQDDVKRILMSNVIGTSNLLEALADVPYTLFVNTGSSSEYGFKQQPMREDDFPEPNSHYAAAKLAQTMLCQYTARSKDKSMVTFRLFSVYGPYEDPSRLVPTLIRRCLKEESLQMVSPQTARDFIFIEDVVDAYINIKPLLGCRGQIFNIGSGTQVSIKEITGLVLGLTGAKVDVQWDAMQSRIWDTPFWVGDVRRAKEILGWQAKTSLEKGLNQTIEWVKSS